LKALVVRLPSENQVVVVLCFVVVWRCNFLLVALVVLVDQDVAFLDLLLAYPDQEGSLHEDY